MNLYMFRYKSYLKQHLQIFRLIFMQTSALKKFAGVNTDLRKGGTSLVHYNADFSKAPSNFDHFIVVESCKKSLSWWVGG